MGLRFGARQEDKKAQPRDVGVADGRGGALPGVADLAQGAKADVAVVILVVAVAEIIEEPGRGVRCGRPRHAEHACDGLDGILEAPAGVEELAGLVLAEGVERAIPKTLPVVAHPNGELGVRRGQIDHGVLHHRASVHRHGRASAGRAAKRATEGAITRDACMVSCSVGGSADGGSRKDHECEACTYAEGAGPDHWPVVVR